MTHSARAPVCFLLFLVGACTGSIGDGLPDDPARPPGSPERTEPTPRAPSPAPVPDVPPPPPAACRHTAVGASPLRRLTRAEYNAAVRSLLGTTARPADDFET